MVTLRPHFFFFFFFNDTATTEIYTLSLHDALPIFPINLTMLIEGEEEIGSDNLEAFVRANRDSLGADECFKVDRKSTRLNSSHQIISYAVFCLKKKKNHKTKTEQPHQPQPVCQRKL